MDKTQAYQVIKDARALMKQHPTSAASEKSKKEYVAIFNRITRGETITPIPFLESTTSRSSFNKMRVSLNFVLRSRINMLLADQDKLQRSDDSDNSDAWLKTVEKLYGVLHQIDDVANASMQCVVKRRSKRSDIVGLASDWRENLILRIQDKDVTAALIAAVAGCRPAELVMGVEIVIGAGVMRVVIQGAKVTKVSGQPTRELVYKLPHESPLVKRLALRLGPGHHLIQIDNASRFSTSVRDAARRAFPALRRTITAYCLRHQAASDLKASGLSGGEVSKSLGHCVDRTASRYGHFKQGKRKGGTAPDSVMATRGVRVRVDLSLFRPAPKKVEVVMLAEIPDPDFKGGYDNIPKLMQL